MYVYEFMSCLRGDSSLGKKKYSSWKINDKKNSRPIKLLTTNLSDKLSWTCNLWLEKNLLMVWYVVLS